jgi:geranylgeranyl reductase family protein
VTAVGLYDIVIVGAGPAGSIAAYESARAGMKVLLLEKSKFPRDKPCGGAVMYRGLRLLDGNLPRSIVEQTIYGLRFVLPSGKVAEFASDKMIGITVFRDKYDEYLARRAEQAGAELLEESRVVRAATDDQCATIFLEDGREFRGRLVIGADGVNSIVSRSLGLRPARKDPYKVGLGMESDFHVGADKVNEIMGGNPHILEIRPVDGRVSYGWVFPKREHLAIGVAGASVHMHPLRPIFDTFTNKLGITFGVELVPEKRRTYFLGGDGLGSRNVVKRGLLIGDAAGFVDPMMGEGIAYAMKSGKFAANVASSCIEADKYDAASLSHYQDLCREEFASNFAMAGWAGAQGTDFAGRILPRVSGHKFAADIMAGVARGEFGYSDIPVTILKRLPQEFPNIIKRIVQSRLTHTS